MSGTKLVLPNLRTMLVLLTALSLAVATPLLAQDESRRLLAGTVLSGELGPDSTAATYIFDAGADSVANIGLSNISASALALHLSDINGNTIASAAAADGAANLSDVSLASGGRYFVFVYFAPGAGAQETIFDLSFDLRAGAPAEAAEAVAAAEPELILLGAGIDVQLSWSGAADLNLEVRGPTGQSLHWNSRATVDGGVFGFDANGLCQVISANPVETATWQPGFLPTGSYEIIIYYKEACDTATGAVPFNVDVSVDGAPSGSIANVLSPGIQGQENVYVSRFVISGDGSAVVSAGGQNPPSSLTSPPSSYDRAGAAATPIARGVPVQGGISNDQPFVAYSFSAAAGEVISVEMQAVGPNLDTLLQILDPAGRVVHVNDDALAGQTDSSIANVQLLSGGSYTIIATRYAMDYGGTQGGYQLTFSGGGSDAASPISGLNLPPGDIQVSLFWSTGADLQLLVRDPIGESVFDDNPFAGSGGILHLAGNVNCIPAETDAPASYIYWPPGRMRPGAYEVEVWYQNPCSELPPPVDFTLLIEVGGVLVADARQFPQPGQRYVTNFTIQPLGAAEAGEGGFIDAGSASLAYQAEALGAPLIESGRPVTGTISAENTFDVFSFNGAAGQTVSISMAAVSQTLDTNLYLISPGGREVAANDDGDAVLLGASGRTTDSLISGYVLAENGPYTIIATRYANQFGGTIGVYQLTLNQN